MNGLCAPALRRLRAATAEDAPAIARVQVDSWRAAYRDLLPAAYLQALSASRHEQRWRESIARGSPEVMLALEGQQVLAWIAFDRSRDPDTVPGCGEIWALYADPAHWSRGLGRDLWGAAHRRLRERGFDAVSLWVLAGNLRAQRFYASLGLAPEALRRSRITIEGREFEGIRYRGSLGRGTVSD